MRVSDWNAWAQGACESKCSGALGRLGGCKSLGSRWMSRRSVGTWVAMSNWCAPISCVPNVTTRSTYRPVAPLLVYLSLLQSNSRRRATHPESQHNTSCTARYRLVCSNGANMYARAGMSRKNQRTGLSEGRCVSAQSEHICADRRPTDARRTMECGATWRHDWRRRRCLGGTQHSPCGVRHRTSERSLRSCTGIGKAGRMEPHAARVE